MAKSSSDKQGSEVVLKGKVGRVGKREYVLVDLPFTTARDILHVDTYSHETGEGYQRGLDEDKARGLAKAMTDGHYTPAGLSASVTDKHTVNRKGESVEILGVTPDNPLACIDGQHRRYALSTLLDNDKTEDGIDWSHTTTPLLILLDHTNQAEDFLNLQRGNSVSRNLMRSLEYKSGLIDDPLVGDATEVIGKLAADTTSFMAGNVAYEANEKRRLQYSTLIASGSSTLGTSIYGGAKIAKEYGKSPKWLYDVYMRGWAYLLENLTPVDPELKNSARKALFTGRLMEPLKDGGNRGGTHLLIGVLNLLAWSTAHADLDTPSDDDLEHMSRCVDFLWAEADYDGGSAPSLRQHLGEYAQAFYKGYKGAKYEGIPTDLIAVLSPSTLDLDAKDYRKATKAKTPKVKAPKTPSDPNAPKRGPGRPPMTDEEKAAAKAKREEEKAAKKSPAQIQREEAAARTALQASKA